MNGDNICTKSTSASQDDQSIRLTQEGKRDAQWQGEGRRTKSITTPKDSKSQRSPCWSDEQLSPQQLPSPQTCLRPTTEHSVPLSNSARHTDNGGSFHGCKRRKVRPMGGGKRLPRRIADGKNSQNRKVTDYYPIRRSSRKSKTALQCEEKQQIDELITKGIEEGMVVRRIEGKGRAVFATRCFQKGEYVVEYHGDLLQITDAKKREAEYAQNPATGCYMYYFQYLCKTYCVDATKETARMGRLINHSKNGNCQTKLHDINGVPHLILVASRHIDEGEELLYDYGDRSKASIAAHPWLKY